MERYNGESLRGAYVSEKFDGVQARWDGRTLTTRTGRPLPAPEWFTRDLPACPLVGELWAGWESFERANSITKGGGDWSNLLFLVFGGREGMPLPAHASYISRTRVREPWDVAIFAAQVQAHGGEGLVVTLADGTMLKLKPESTADGEVMSWNVADGETFKSLNVKLRNGKGFKLASGVDRFDPPPVGSIVEFSYQGETKAGKPRHATLKRVRAEEVFV